MLLNLGVAPNAKIWVGTLAMAQVGVKVKTISTLSQSPGFHPKVTQFHWTEAVLLTSFSVIVMSIQLNPSGI